MEIRKTFKFEMAHCVRKAYTERCSKSIHGHSYIVEIVLGSDFIEGAGFDKAGMLIDFGKVKKLFKEFIDLFDHASMHWRRVETKEYLDFYWNNYDRVIITDFNSTAEIQAMMFRNTLNQLILFGIIDDKIPQNLVHVKKVRVHETSTGYAESSQKDCTEKCLIEYVPKSTDFKHLDKNSELAKTLDEIHRK